MWLNQFWALLLFSVNLKLCNGSSGGGGGGGYGGGAPQQQLDQSSDSGSGGKKIQIVYIKGIVLVLNFLSVETVVSPFLGLVSKVLYCLVPIDFFLCVTFETMKHLMTFFTIIAYNLYIIK